MKYMIESYDNFGKRELREIIRVVRPKGESEMMSQFAQEVINKEKPGWIQVGRQEGEATMFLNLLKQRFGPLPDWVPEKVRNADQDTLEKWSKFIFDADSLNDLLV
ncbi:MAG: DUF4351 domain-containing protein [Magnetococcales bacterium]|nr:DUF4351 domain-containing protein [Magnetococcales bacterium]